MIKSLYPFAEEKSVYSIDFEKLFNDGFRGIIFDIDNTLVRHGEPASEAAKKLFEYLRGLGFKTCLLSNNKEKRVRPFAEAVGSDFIASAGKPKKAGYMEAARRTGADISATVFVGDQIFTDIWGANRAGIKSILVRPINPKEEIQIVMKRRIESAVLFGYHRYIRKNKSGR